MNKFKGIALSMAAVCTLGACSYDSFSEVEALNSSQAVGSPFTQRLASEYRDFSNIEQNEMFDYPDSLHFARKGLAAAAGEAVLPEPISDWNLSPEHVKELGTARARLIGVLDMGAREMMPDQAAVAQARFDCWIEQQEENWQKDDISTCKNDFYGALKGIEDQLAAVATPAEPPVTIEAEPAEPMKIENAVYLVFFDFDKASLTEEANSIVDAVVTELGNRGDVKTISVVGHTDTAGSNAYNQRLAMKRAQALMDVLVARGVNPALIRMESRGETDLIVKTADGIREPANRRVSISFE
ncbi:MAG: OmpA family protein [Rhodospirillales bacterium]|nr:OmpA family protein [Rhodospirillales bacterium]MCB9980373.1 OmpA family protein [Rhodospirillales bacterium]